MSDLRKWLGYAITGAAPVLWVGAAVFVVALIWHPAWRYDSSGVDRRWIFGALVLAAWVAHVGIAFHVAISPRFTREDRRAVWRETFKGSYAHYRRVLRRRSESEPS
jgi:hypothetical protein